MTITFTEAVLAPAEERLLAQRIEAGLLAEEVLATGASWPAASADDLRAVAAEGQQAFQRFVAANYRLVALVTNRAAARTDLDPDDLFQEGVLGLMEALRRYDHRRPNRFATFALPWIKMRVADYVVTKGGRSGLPVSRAKRWARVSAVHEELTGRHGREPSAGEVARATGYPERQVVALRGYRPPLRLAVPVDRAWPEPDPDPAEDALWARRTLRRLPRLDREILTDLYGLDGRPRLGHAEVARRRAISESTVRRRERNALVVLRQTAQQEALAAA